jgi:Flp pilus assembly protein TadG
MMRGSFRRLRRDRRGATIVEFGFVAPVMALFLVGAFDIGHTLYMRGVLQGIVQKMARDSSLENATTTAAQTALNNRVRDQVLALRKGADVTFSRRFYRTFSAAAAAQAETWTVDTNGNGVCDAGEPFVDRNNNGVRDLDGGDSGQGGAIDRSLYTVSVSYPRMLPLDKFIGGSGTTKITASTILQNQPYNEQGSYGASTTGNCP